MSAWHRHTIDDGGSFLVEFLPSADLFWPPYVLRDHPLSVARVAGHTAVLTGAGSVWMYAHAAAALRAAGAGDICVRTPHRPGISDDIEGSASLLTRSSRLQESGVLLTVHLRTSPPLSARAVNQLLEPRLEELSRLRPQKLVLSGRASSEVYARAARAAVDCGVRWITCWSARDGLIVVHDPDGAQLGRRIARPDWLAQSMPQPVSPQIIGVTGDPNRGKSVLSAVLDWYRERVGCEGWKLDCDGQSPTPAWYLSMIGQEEAGVMREAQKRPWTSEMESCIVEQMCQGRELFPVLIADLPGGNHKVNPPQRVPTGRERVFAEIDALVVLAGADAPSEAAWRDALRPHGLDGRIAAVLTSRDPKGPPSLTVRQDGNLWRGEVTGLDRDRASKELGEAFRTGFDSLWPALLDFARSRTNHE